MSVFADEITRIAEFSPIFADEETYPRKQDTPHEWPWNLPDVDCCNKRVHSIAKQSWFGARRRVH